jgi:hypothetical protein
LLTVSCSMGGSGKVTNEGADSRFA